MPWCEPCERFYNPNTLDDEGDCPEGHHVADRPEEAPPARVPWHFKLMVAFAAAYLGWRVLQLLWWSIDGVL